jgi:hypothetical protein
LFTENECNVPHGRVALLSEAMTLPLRSSVPPSATDHEPEIEAVVRSTPERLKCIVKVYGAGPLKILVALSLTHPEPLKVATFVLGGEGRRRSALPPGPRPQAVAAAAPWRGARPFDGRAGA